MTKAVTRRKLIGTLALSLGTLSLVGYSLFRKGSEGRIAVGKRHSVEFLDQWLVDFYFKDITEIDVVKYPNSDDFLLINGILVRSSDVIVKVANK